MDNDIFLRMQKRYRKSQFIRWILVPFTVIIAYYAGLYILLSLCLFLPFPPALAEPTGGFAMGFLVAFISGITAPSHRLVTAMIALVIAFALSCFWRLDFITSSFLGSLCGLALIAWWFSPRRTPRSVLLVGRIVCASLVLYVLTVYAFHKDWFARPSTLPIELTNALGTNASQVRAFYRYYRGGFIDHEWLWRVEAKPEILAQMAVAFGLEKTNSVPSAFLRLPPYYWPRSIPAGGGRFSKPILFI